MRLYGGPTVTDMEHIEVSRASDTDHEDVIVIDVNDVPSTRLLLSLDVAEALQYALEQALR